MAVTFTIAIDGSHSSIHTKADPGTVPLDALNSGICALEQERAALASCPVHRQREAATASDVLAWMGEREWKVLRLQLAEAIANGEVQRAGWRHRDTIARQSSTPTPPERGYSGDAIQGRGTQTGQHGGGGQ